MDLLRPLETTSPSAQGSAGTEPSGVQLPDQDALDALFAREPAKAEASSKKSGRRKFQIPGWRRIAVVVLALVALGEGALLAAAGLSQAARRRRTGTVSVQTNPPGVAVFVDGVSRGNTPARLSLAPGSHILELRGRGVPRVVPITVTAGAEVSQYLELPETPSTGSLLIQSDPAGAQSVGRRRPAWRRARQRVGLCRQATTRSCCRRKAARAVRQRVVIQAGVTVFGARAGGDRVGRSGIGMAVGEVARRDGDPRRTAG